jgi:hypothetical protein
MSDGRIMRHQMNSRLNDHRLLTLCIERRLNGVENFVFRERNSLDVWAVEVDQINVLQSIALS